MTVEADRDTDRDPKDRADSSASSKPKHSAKHFDVEAEIKKLRESGVTESAILAFVTTFTKSLANVNEELKKKLITERERRMSAEMDCSSMKVELNIMRIERDEVINKEENEKYEGIEDAGAW